MKKLLIFCASLSLSIFIAIADTTKQPQQPKEPQQPERTSSSRPIIITQKRIASSSMRAPAMPIYGYFDGQMLTVDFMAAEDNEILTIYYHCEASVEQQVCSAAELCQGITVTVTAPFWLEIVTESGVVYIEYCDEE